MRHFFVPGIIGLLPIVGFGLVSWLEAQGAVADKPRESAKRNAADEEPKPRLKATVLGTKFLVHPAFEAVIAEKVAAARKELRAHRQKGMFIGYICVPLTARGGGHEGINREISLSVKKRLEDRYGLGFWALAPGQADYALPEVKGVKPEGGDYLYMWTEILAGEDGKGSDFDLVYFTGPTDVHAFFNLPHKGLLDVLDNSIDIRARLDVTFRQEVAEQPKPRRAFLRYYGLCASTAFSNGCHDEWNLFLTVNRRRGVIGDQLPMYYDGRALSMGEMATAVGAGYEQK